MVVVWGGVLDPSASSSQEEDSWSLSRKQEVWGMGMSSRKRPCHCDSRALKISLQLSSHSLGSVHMLAHTQLVKSKAEIPAQAPSLLLTSTFPCHLPVSVREPTPLPSLENDGSRRARRNDLISPQTYRSSRLVYLMEPVATGRLHLIHR